MVIQKILVIGGGNGQGRILKGWKDTVRQLCAVVNMTDDGGSTGRLRKHLGALAVGDIRNCLIALADPNRLWTDFSAYRFPGNKSAARDIGGHSLGNLILVALAKRLDSLPKAIKLAARELGIKPTHQVYPSTLDPIVLHAKLVNGDRMVGQYRISHNVPANTRIDMVCLKHESPRREIKANPDALTAIKRAKIIVIAPGTLYGSLLPAMIVPEIKKALESSKAYKVYFLDIALKPKWEDTRGFTPKDYIKAIQKHLPRLVLNLVVVNNHIPKGVKARFLTWDDTTMLGIPVLQANLVDESDYANGSFYNHSHTKIKSILPKIIARAR